MPATPPPSSSTWESRLIAEARRLIREEGRGPLSKAELDRAGRDLLELQRGLTAGRALIGKAYMDEERRLASYLLFYWQVSYAQTRGLLAMAEDAHGALFRDSSVLRILDLGSGPAPCALAAADYFSRSCRNISITARDQSALAVEIAGRLAASSNYAFDGEGCWRAGESSPPRGTFDLIVLGHVLNELYHGRSDRIERRTAFLGSILPSLAEGGLLVLLEPALEATSRDLLSVRDYLCSKGLSVLAPCFTDAPCPALELPGQSCHSDFRWEVPSTVRELSARTGLDKALVKSSAFVFRKGNGPEPEDDASASVRAARYRAVSEPMLNKAGRQRLLVCGVRGRFPLSAKKGEGFPDEKLFLSLARGDAFSLERPVERETGLALGQDTKITRIGPGRR